MKTERNYMNPQTGAIGTKEDWDYEDINGNTRNAVDEGEVVEVEKKRREWVERI